MERVIRYYPDDKAKTPTATFSISFENEEQMEFKDIKVTKAYQNGFGKGDLMAYIGLTSTMLIAELTGFFFDLDEGRSFIKNSGFPCEEYDDASASARIDFKEIADFISEAVCRDGEYKHISEEDFIYAGLVWSHNADIDVKRASFQMIEGLNIKFTYKGDEYTDIHLEGLHKDEYLGIGVWFSARKNGGERAVYHLLTKSCNFVSGTLAGSTYLLPTPSHGLVELGEKYRYVGHLRCIKKAPLTDDLALAQAHLFFERNGEDYTFYVLRNGRLRKKIEKTDNAVRFYNTRLVFKDDASEEAAKDELAFEFTKGADGKYRLGKYLFKKDKLDSTVDTYDTIIEMPQASDTEKDDSFYKKCVIALYKAFESSERYILETKYGAGLEETVSQIGIKRDNDDRARLTADYFKDGALTLSVSVPVSDDDVKLFAQDFSAAFPQFSIEKVDYAIKGIENDGNKNDYTITLRPTGEKLVVEISDKEEQYKGYFSQLRPVLNFDKSELAPNLVFYKRFEKAVINGFNTVFGIICTALASSENIDACKKALMASRNMDALKAEIRYTLYESKGLIPDENVVSQAVRLKNSLDRSGIIPNIEIIGQAGTGKSTLVDNLAEVFRSAKFFKDKEEGENKVLHITAPDLKAEYLGQTRRTLQRMIRQAAEENMILYIDEVYTLMNDEYGADAVSVLLPLLTGDQKKFEYIEEEGALKVQYTVKVDFEKGTIEKTDANKRMRDGYPINIPKSMVPVWISGYEHEVRQMINQNQGLYRRFEKIVIKPPVTYSLYSLFKDKLDEYVGHADETVSMSAANLRSYLETNGDEVIRRVGDKTEKVKIYKPIRNFFIWGSGVQNSKYFANNAGVYTFLNRCIDSIDFSGDVGRQIEEIISDTKIDIKRQLADAKAGNANRDTGWRKSPDPSDTVDVITDIDTRFDDVVGCEEQKTYMRGIIEMLVNKSAYDDLKLTVPKGALMEGPPGTGKTFMARAMAGELQQRFEDQNADKRFGFISFSGSELAGRPAENIAAVFAMAEEYHACIMFIDEADAVAKRRNSEGNSEHLIELLRQMDGIEKRSNVFILAATNAPADLDPAFKRPGRIDKRLVFSLPEKHDCKKLAGIALTKRHGALYNYNYNKDEEEKLAELVAGRMYGCTPEDINNVINNAFVAYHQFYNKNNTESPIDKEFFKSYPFIDIENDKIDTFALKEDTIKQTALRELYMFIDEEIERLNGHGAQKRAVDNDGNAIKEAFDLSKNKGRSATAIHEVGHAVASLILDPNEKPFDTITTIPRGESLGYVTHSEMEFNTKADFIARIKVCMGGRLAEEIVYGKENISPGAMKDMRQATRVARRMTEIFGFSDEFGFMALTESSGNYYGGDNYYTCSDEFRAKSDAAVSELLKQLYKETHDLLKDKKELIEKLAEHVFKDETMTGERFKELYEEELKNQENR